MPKLFTKDVIVDEVLVDDPRYNILEDAGGAFKADMQINLATSVAVAGTEIDAAVMNNLEDGLDALDTKVSDILDALTTGGTSTAYTVTTPGAKALATNERFSVIFHVTAGATPTLNRDAKGAKALKYYDSTGAKVACSATSIVSGIRSDIVYDGTDYIVLDALPSTGGGGTWGSITGTLSAQTDLQAVLDAKTGVDGWIPVSDSWTYASANTINVPTGAASLYSKGDKIKITQSGEIFLYVISVADTLLTITGGSDYSVANAAISNIFYSHAASPAGFPNFFNTASLVVDVATFDNGSGGQPTTAGSVFMISGRQCVHFFCIQGTKAGTNATVNYTRPSTIPPPYLSTTIALAYGVAYAWDAVVSGFLTTPGSSTAFTIRFLSNITDNTAIPNGIIVQYSYLF